MHIIEVCSMVPWYYSYGLYYVCFTLIFNQQILNIPILFIDEKFFSARQVICIFFKEVLGLFCVGL